MFALTLAECVHELFQLRRTLDLKEDLVIVVRDFDVEVLGRLRCSGLLILRWGTVVVRHVENVVVLGSEARLILGRVVE